MIKFLSIQENEVNINWNFENLVPGKGDKILIDNEKQPEIKVKDVVWNTKTDEILIYTSFNENYGQYSYAIA